MLNQHILNCLAMSAGNVFKIIWLHEVILSSLQQFRHLDSGSVYLQIHNTGLCPTFDVMDILLYFLVDIDRFTSLPSSHKTL